MGAAQDATRIEVGVRELRDHLSHYLARVRAGEEVVVTDNGEPVAYIVRRPGSSRLAELIAAGRATAPRTRRRSSPPPIEFHGTDAEVEALIKEQRA